MSIILGTLRKSQLALWVQFPILALLSCSTGLAGLAIYSYYRDCDPVLEGRIQKKDQILPLFVLDTMGRFPGVYMHCIPDV